MRIEEGKFYRTRDGRKVGPMSKPRVPYEGANATVEDLGGSLPCRNIWWANGKGNTHDELPEDLIAEWSDSPIRTVTRKEIVPGTYGVIRIDKGANGYVFDMWKANANADELREAARLFNQIAEVLSDV